MTTRPNRLLALLFTMSSMSGCVDAAPIPPWVYDCQNTQSGPDCAPEDVRSETDAGQPESGPTL